MTREAWALLGIFALAVALVVLVGIVSAIREDRRQWVEREQKAARRAEALEQVRRARSVSPDEER